MPVIGHCFTTTIGLRKPSVVEDSIGREQIAVAARLLRTISVSDGDIEILLHEMARTLEGLAEADGCRRSTRVIPLATRYATGVARI